MGEICRMKANRENNANNKTGARVEPLFVRRPPARSYLVFTSPRVIVRVEEDADGRFAYCPCSTDMCEHRRLVAEADRTAFPVDLFADNVIQFPAPSAEEKEEFPNKGGGVGDESNEIPTTENLPLESGRFNNRARSL